MDTTKRRIIPLCGASVFGCLSTQCGLGAPGYIQYLGGYVGVTCHVGYGEPQQQQRYEHQHAYDEYDAYAAMGLAIVVVFHNVRILQLCLA